MMREPPLNRAKSPSESELLPPRLLCTGLGHFLACITYFTPAERHKGVIQAISISMWHRPSLWIVTCVARDSMASTALLSPLARFEGTCNTIFFLAIDCTGADLLGLRDSVQQVTSVTNSSRFASSWKAVSDWNVWSSASSTFLKFQGLAPSTPHEYLGSVADQHMSANNAARVRTTTLS